MVTQPLFGPLPCVTERRNHFGWHDVTLFTSSTALLYQATELAKTAQVVIAVFHAQTRLDALGVFYPSPPLQVLGVGCFVGGQILQVRHHLGGRVEIAAVDERLGRSHFEEVFLARPPHDRHGARAQSVEPKLFSKVVFAPDRVLEGEVKFILAQCSVEFV